MSFILIPYTIGLKFKNLILPNRKLSIKYNTPNSVKNVETLAIAFKMLFIQV